MASPETQTFRGRSRVYHFVFKHCWLFGLSYFLSIVVGHIRDLIMARVGPCSDRSSRGTSGSEQEAKLCLNNLLWAGSRIREEPLLLPSCELSLVATFLIFNQLC